MKQPRFLGNGHMAAPIAPWRIDASKPTKRKAQKHLSAKSLRRQERRLEEARRGGWGPREAVKVIPGTRKRTLKRLPSG